MTDKPEVFIQWKNIDACLDMYCECGARSHVHGEFMHFIKCIICGRIYKLPHMVSMTLATEEELAEWHGDRARPAFYGTAIDVEGTIEEYNERMAELADEIKKHTEETRNARNL